MNELGWWIIPQIIVPYLVIGFLYAGFVLEDRENRSYNNNLFYVKDHFLRTRFKHQAVFILKYMGFWPVVVFKKLWRRYKYFREQLMNGRF